MIERNDIEKIEDKEWARKATFMSGFRTNLGGMISYKDLVDTFGEPTFTPEDSGDGKVNYEWVFIHDGNYFTIYDWKTYDAETTRNEYTNWHVGGKAGVLETDGFVRSVLEEIRLSIFS
tara:strand:+ start:16 stop:372 length:357 start_codon:yes stop_codon:yes gene_type:complete